jgi:uncharacterized Zn finger protein
MAQPHCPNCKIEGIDHIVSTESIERSKHKSPWFHIIHCDSCGHVYNTIAKDVFVRNRGNQVILPERKMGA